MIAMLDIAELRGWATDQMTSRGPDFIIGANYLRRWWIVPRNPFCSVYLHEILQSDDDRALHDHPWDNTSVVLDGGYTEHTPDGVFERVAGDVVSRPAQSMHRLVIPDGGRAVTLFLTGPRVREWGFDCPNGWRVWSEFVSACDSGQIGRGCGD